MLKELELLGMEEKTPITSCAYCTVITDDKGPTYICTGGCNDQRNQPIPAEPFISQKARRLTDIKEEQKQ